VVKIFWSYNSVANGNNAMLRARLIASPSHRWWREHVPVMRAAEFCLDLARMAEASRLLVVDKVHALDTEPANFLLAEVLALAAAARAARAATTRAAGTAAFAALASPSATGESFAALASPPPECPSERCAPPLEPPSARGALGAGVAAGVSGDAFIGSSDIVFSFLSNSGELHAPIRSGPSV